MTRQHLGTGMPRRTSSDDDDPAKPFRVRYFGHGSGFRWSGDPQLAAIFDYLEPLQRRKGGAPTASPVWTSKRAWCQGQRIVPSATIPSASGAQMRAPSGKCADAPLMSDQHDILPVQYTGDDPTLPNLGGGDAVRQVTIGHRLFPSLFRSKSVGALQRGRGQMLADEPDLRFVRADDIAD